MPDTMRQIPFLCTLLLLGSAALVAFRQTGNKDTLTVRRLPFSVSAPTAFAASPDETGRLFVCEQSGAVRIIRNEKLLERPFLDLKSKLVSLATFYDERGLLGITFHPAFRKNRRFYVYYSAPGKEGTNHKSILAEYRASEKDPDLADPTERVIMEIDQPEMNHNGGQLAFGPDGYLYIGLGDGGGGGDKHGITGNGQDLGTLLGKILRIDVNNGNPYAVPPDNPFVKDKARPEIWAYGLRNPWRFSFDRVSKRLFCADVGQNKYEEVNLIEKGGNYGWRIMEGRHCYNPKKDCNQKNLILPISEYDHSVGKSITGGFVYRGNRQSLFYGSYIYADWTGKVFALSEEKGRWVNRELKVKGLKEGDYITSFGEDNAGELYMLVNQGVSPRGKGGMYRLQL
jgi:glucose/arabinose dehydrogenase